ncbi:MAG: 4'-phosphopantetheinyl transferase superfamily protein [Proteobacteria bacterium]|nr:4'-phosphopantetheinyl transferase superfamily protein [Pseudomonadota bacterium]
MMENELTVWINFNPHKLKLKAKKKSDAILQNLLSEYSLNKPPFEIFKSKNGKPYINEQTHFSYAHCGHVYVYVIQKNSAIGVDIEKISHKRSWLNIAKRYFHPTEFRHLQNLKGDEKLRFFYTLWTRKEACCKLEGGVLWHYLSKNFMNSEQKRTKMSRKIVFYDVSPFKHFSFTVATTTQINMIRFNTLT